MTERSWPGRRSVLGLAMVLIAVLSACGAGPTSTALGKTTSGTITVVTDFAPPNHSRTTPFTTRTEVAELRAAIVKYDIKIDSSQQGKMDGCTGGVNVTLSVKLSGRTGRLTGHSYMCGNQQQGTLVGNVADFVSDLGVSPG
jgi:hypothetical protein